MTKEEKLIELKSFLGKTHLTHKVVAGKLNKGYYVEGTLRQWLHSGLEIPDDVIPQLEALEN